MQDGTVNLDRARDAMHHRGPDMAGKVVDGNIYLGFRRLAILDLSADGDQPMTTPDGRYTIVFNGEIYNFLELKTELEKQGREFRGRSDTEVLLSLYATLGPACLDKLNGMFAFAIYDRFQQKVFVARDRLGQKPLFLRQRNGSIAFASEICAFRQLPDFSKELDEKALSVYFRLGMIPEWLSVYPGVTKLPPGSWAIIDLVSEKVGKPVRYWTLPPVGEEHGKSEKQWLDEIEALLWDATRIRLRSDVPVGVFLSGGIDSGLVAAAAASQTTGVRAMAVGFPNELQDETALAQASAKHLGLDLIVNDLCFHEGMHTLPKVMACFDEPFADGSALPTYLICAEARKHFKVVLSGDAGDEVFGGYPSHVRAWRWRGIDSLPAKFRYVVGLLGASLTSKDSKARRFFQRLPQPVGRFGLGGTLYPFQNWLDSCISSPFNMPPQELIQMFDEHLPRWDDATSIDHSQRIDLSTYLVNDILVKIDRMSMANSLELRSPFLDYRLVDLGLRVPSKLRVKDGKNKYLLRKLATRHLPAKVCAAQKKGFGIPLRRWLRSECFVRDLPRILTSMKSKQPAPLTVKGVQEFIRLYEKNASLTAAMMNMLCYSWWCNFNLVSEDR